MNKQQKRKNYGNGVNIRHNKFECERVCFIAKMFNILFEVINDVSNIRNYNFTFNFDCFPTMPYFLIPCQVIENGM